MGRFDEILNPGLPPRRYAPSSAPSAGGAGFQVQVEELEAMARAAEDVAEQAREGTAKLGTPTAAAARGLAGWATGEALTGCLAAWEDHLRRLGQDVAGTADKLRANARGYQQSDEAARHSFGGG